MHCKGWAKPHQGSVPRPYGNSTIDERRNPSPHKGEVDVQEVYTSSRDRRDDCRRARACGNARRHERRSEGGATFPFSGPASPLSNTGKGLIAYINSINERGGINGRKINLITYDDAYSPPKTVEQTRKLVESDEVAFLFGPLGTPGIGAPV